MYVETKTGRTDRLEGLVARYPDLFMNMFYYALLELKFVGQNLYVEMYRMIEYRM